MVAADSPHLGGRIDRLVQELAGGTRAHVAGLFDFDCVAVNAQPTREPWRRLVAGDQVQVRFEEGRRYHARPRPRQHQGFAVVYEDRELIVVDKSAELLTVPTERREPNTLVDRVNEYVRRTKKGKGAFPVHRLDRGVSGLLVLGKTAEIAALIRDQFAARKPERKYVAIVAGRLAQPAGQFRSFLATDASLRRFSTDDEEIGQLAITHYQVVETWQTTSLVEVHLETGRRNQIRVHFSEAGHPVLGDPRYRPEAARHPDWPHRRIALHAQTLAVTHPNSEQQLRFESQLPAEMVRFILKVRQALTSRTGFSGGASRNAAPSTKTHSARHPKPTRKKRPLPP
jgi:23S rRNA pseudouridine1911/1915/1917 synthase